MSPNKKLGWSYSQTLPSSPLSIDTVNMMLFVNVAGQAYHEMRKVCKQMPTHYKVKKRIAEINTMWKNRPTPNGTVGMQQSLKVRVCMYMVQLFYGRSCRC